MSVYSQSNTFVQYSKFHFLTTLSLAIDSVFLQYNSSDFRCPDPAPDLQYICNVGEFSYKDILKEKKKSDKLE